MAIIQELEKQIQKILNRKNDVIKYFEKQGNLDFANAISQNVQCQRLFSLHAKTLKELRMAVIMDEFTLESYQPECQLIELTPDNWRSEIENFKPDLLFIESAWKGKDGLWYQKIDRSSKEIHELTDYCHSENIPVIFWNKEDPVYTSQFMTTASMADVVFTTDMDSIHRYKAELGHNEVYHLHFAAQPVIHNPIEKYARKDKFCFAGAYYHKYKHRAEVFDRFADVFIQTKGFDIYDRNYQNARPEHAFPERYHSYILGSLPSNKIDVAYKGYVYGINMNSVQQSQTMFARRVFEMLASNTITVGNYSRGVKNYFGDLTICTDDEHTMESCLQKYCVDDCSVNKYRLAGLREVLLHHLYEDRLDYIVEKVFHVNLQKKLPTVAMVARCADKKDIENVIAIFNRQTYANKVLYILGVSGEEQEKNIKYFSRDEAESTASTIENIDFYACISAKDYYGPNYLLDIMLTSRYGSYNGVGKAAYYEFTQTDFELREPKTTYCQVPCLVSERAVIKHTLTINESLWSVSEVGKKWENNELFSVDEFNYCSNYCGAQCEKVDDFMIHDKGISLAKIQNIAEHIKMQERDDLSVKKITGKDLSAQIKSTKSVSYKVDADDLKIDSHLKDGIHEYAFTSQIYPIGEFIQEGKIQVKFHAEGSLDCICVCVFYDNNGTKLEPQYPKANVTKELIVPGNATGVKFGFRPKGMGTYTVHNVSIGLGIAPADEMNCFLSRAEVLVVSNQYPTPDSLYRNMFVHKRMTAYKEEGQVYDVMRMNAQVEQSYREFDGINVVDGQQEVLASILESGQIKTVCVHFLDAMMWNVLKDYINQIRVLVWCHGSEIQPWWRREYNYHSKAELEDAKKASDKRMRFWQGIFSNIDEYPNLHFIFVSDNFAKGVFEDYKIELKKNRYSIIHNCIDTDMFRFTSKSAEQRKKILSIRPYASSTYANDLSVSCIQELAKKAYFKDLEIRLIGNGVLLESTLKPIKKYKNITIEKRFLRQEEIAELHKQFGIFLVPTRMDSQGVARDEAMSSGLVPITNAVAAIPEFTDESCAILAPGEDYMEMAAGIDKLYHNPELFLKMSENAARRVRRQTSKEYTIDREIELICAEENKLLTENL